MNKPCVFYFYLEVAAGLTVSMETHTGVKRGRVFTAAQRLRSYRRKFLWCSQHTAFLKQQGVVMVVALALVLFLEQVEA